MSNTNKQKWKQGISILITLGFVLFIIGLLAWLMVLIAKWIFGTTEPINEVGAWSSFFVGYTAGAIAIYWNYKSSARDDLVSRGSISLSSSPENVITVTNAGATPLNITGINESFLELKRNDAVGKSLQERFNKQINSGNWDETDISLGSGDSFVLPFQRGATKAIELIELAFQVIGIRYRVSNRVYVKYYCFCRLTSPTSWYRYQISQIGQVDVMEAARQLVAQGKYYPEALIDKYIYDKSYDCTLDISIFPQAQDVPLVKKSYQELLGRSAIQIAHYPENIWFVLGIKELN